MGNIVVLLLGTNKDYVCTRKDLRPFCQMSTLMVIFV